MKTACIKYLDQITKYIDKANPVSDTLFGGELALSYYYYYLYETTGDEAYGNTAIEKLEKVLAKFNKEEASLHGTYYCNGLSGLFYLLVLFMKKGLVSNDMQEDVQLLAGQLLAVALTGIDDDYNDFAHGTFGTLHCLILYAELFKDTQFLLPFLEKIEQQHLQSDTPWIPSYIVKPTEKITVNFSFAHGQPSLLMLLMKAYSLTGITPIIKQQLQRNVDYVLSFKGESPIGETHNYFPSMIHPVTKEHNASKRLAWCYSDFGQIYLLYKAATFFDNEQYRKVAEDTGLKTTLRTTYATTCLDSAQLCHGSGGVSQMYYSLWKQTGTTAYKAAGDFWLGQTLTFLEKELAAEVSNTMCTDIIEGLPGVGLVLMSYIADHQLDWTDLILL